MWLLKLALIQGLGVGFSEPRLLVEYSPLPWLVVGQETFSVCNPSGVLSWNPSTIHWDAFAGLRLGGVSVQLGHISNHRLIGEWPARDLKSFEYIRLEYKKEF